MNFQICEFASQKQTVFSQFPFKVFGKNNKNREIIGNNFNYRATCALFNSPMFTAVKRRVFLYQSRKEQSPNRPEVGHPENLPKTRPSNPRLRPEMTQSCPTPPQSRRKFLLSRKAIRSPFLSRNWRQQSDGAMSGRHQNWSLRRSLISSFA